MTVAAPEPLVRHVLLADGSFWLDAEPALAPLLARWLPLLPYGDRVAARGGGHLSLRTGDPAPSAPAGPAGLQLGGASAWLGGDEVRLRGSAGGEGRLDLARAMGTLTAPAAGSAALGWDVYSMTTLAVALMLGRAGRALVHAAAPVDPAGRAWLLVGDSHAGKSTTCANLIAAGWRFASDDHVVLARGADGQLWVEGLPRRFHLDEGWGAAGPIGRRGETDPRERWPGRWVERAPLGGVLLPHVSPRRPTAASPVGPAEALAELIRQSPWLMADRAAAPALLGLLRDAAAVSPHHLTLGLDTFAAPPKLASILEPLG